MSESRDSIFLKFKSGICISKHDQAQMQNSESQFSFEYQIDQCDPIEAVLNSYHYERWKRRKTKFQYSESFSDQYLSEFKNTDLFSNYEPWLVTIYIHFHENSKDKVLRLNRIDRNCSLGEVLNVVSKYPITDLIVKTNTGKILDINDLSLSIDKLIVKKLRCCDSFHIYVQIPGTDKPRPPFQWLGKHLDYVESFFLSVECAILYLSYAVFFLLGLLIVIQK